MGLSKEFVKPLTSNITLYLLHAVISGVYILCTIHGFMIGKTSWIEKTVKRGVRSSWDFWFGFTQSHDEKEAENKVWERYQLETIQNKSWIETIGTNWITLMLNIKQLIISRGLEVLTNGTFLAIVISVVGVCISVIIAAWILYKTKEIGKIQLYTLTYISNNGQFLGWRSARRFI